MPFTWGQRRAPAFVWGNQPRKGSASRDYMNGLAGGIMGQRFPGFGDYRTAQETLGAHRAVAAPAAHDAPQFQATPDYGMFDGPMPSIAPRWSNAPDDGGAAGMFEAPSGDRFATVRPRRRIRDRRMG